MSWECLECVSCTYDTSCRCRNSHNSIQKQKEKKKTIKPSTGDLLIDGVIYRENLPFALLNDIKRRKINEGIEEKRIKITYTKCKV